MPLKVRKRGGKWCVVDTDNKSVPGGCHDTKDAANKQRIAISIATGKFKQPDADGMADVSGTTEAARDTESFLHDHKFQLIAKLDDAGEVSFVGDTTESKKNLHTHLIESIASNSEQVEYQIETEISSTGHSHRHLIKIILDEPLDVPADEVNEEDDSVDKDIQENKMPKTADVLTSTKTRDSGIVFFKGDNNPNKTFENSDIAFASKINYLSIHKDNGQTILRHEVLRTGIFVHPWHGIIKVDDDKINGLKDNFDRNILGQDIAFNISHNSELGALGWHQSLHLESKEFDVVNPDNSISIYEGISLFSDTVLTPFGDIEIIKLRKFRYTSAEIMWDFEDVERFDEANVIQTNSRHPDDDDGIVEDEMVQGKDGKTVKKVRKNTFANVLTGSAATNDPFIPRLTAFAASADYAYGTYNKLVKKYPNPIHRFSVIHEELNRRGIEI